MEQYLPLILLVIVIGGLTGIFKTGGQRGVPRVAGRPLMTPREVTFWRMLRSVADPYHVAPQVAMNALLTTERGLDKRQWRSTRNSFDKKVVDFALVDDMGVVQLLIELDDRTHNTVKDVMRDRMTARAHYRTLRVNGQHARDPQLLANAIGDALS